MRVRMRLNPKPAVVGAAFFALGAANSVNAQAWCGTPVLMSSGGPISECGATCVICDHKDSTGSPCLVKTGNYIASATDLSLPASGLDLSLRRSYNGGNAQDGPLGVGWSPDFGNRILYSAFATGPATSQNEAWVAVRSATRFRFQQNADGSFTPPAGSHDQLVRNADATFDLRLPGGTVQHYDAQGSVLSATDEHANSLSYTYDAGGRLEQIADSSGSGRYVNIYWGANGRISSLQDSTGRQVQYGYDAQGMLTSVTDVAGHTTTYTYTAGRFGTRLLTQIKDHWNRVLTDVTYDSLNRTATYTEAGESYSYAYNVGGDPTRATKTDSSGNVWTYVTTAAGPISDRTPPVIAGGGSAAVHSDFNPDGSVQQRIDEVGVRTFYTYDALGVVQSVTQDHLGSSPVRYDYAYDPNFPDKVTSVTPRDPSTNAVDPNWQAWRYDYYQSGSTSPGSLFHVYRVRDDGTTIDTIATYTYDAKGRITSQSTATGATTSYVYDAQGNLQTVTAPANNDTNTHPVTTYGYDTAGRVTSVTDPLGHQTTYTYDALGRVLTVTLPKPAVGSPLTFTTTYSYDNYDSPSGLLFTNVTDPNGKLTKLGYDQFGRLVTSIDAANNATTYAYLKGALQSITDANGNVTSYTYDALKRLTQTTFPDGAIESYTYFADGQLRTKTNRLGTVTTFAYDARKRLTSKTYSSGGSIAYTYQGQKLTQVVDTSVNPNETHTFTYDGAYRVATNGQASRGTVSYTYTSDERVATMGIGSGPTTTYGYYPDGSMKSLDWTPTAGQFQYQYTLAGQYQQVTLANGQTRTYSYDDQGRLLQIANQLGATNLATYAYGYDLDNQSSTYTMLGQRTSQTATVPTQGFTGALTKYYYDNLYQLNRADYPSAAPFNGEIDSWTYDSIGNRLTNTVNGGTQTYAYFKNAGNSLNSQKLQTDGASTYAYNATGANTGITGGSSYTLGYDNEVRLTSISGSTAATYAYDYQGRRTSKTVGGVTTTYLYDGVTPIGETVGGTPRYYLNGPGIDEPLAVYAGGAMTYLASDALGSVVLENDPSAAVTRSTIFDAWGGVKSETGTRASSFTYTGREVGEAGFHFYRARYYQPGIGRFQQEDPAEVGLTSLYAYVRNAPEVFVDPLGLWEWHPHLTIRKTLNMENVCTRKDNAGECAFLDGATVSCSCACDGQFYRMKVNLDFDMRIYAYAGPFAKMKKPKTDKSVVDAESTVRHVFNFHIFPSIRSIDALASAFEMKVFSFKEECLGACSLARGQVPFAFGEAFRRTQNLEDSGQVP